MKAEDLKNLITKDLIWYSMDDQPCVNTFSKSYYVNLCRYVENDEEVIWVDVDNMKTGEQDVFNMTFKKGTPEFDYFLGVFKQATQNPIDILSKMKKRVADKKLALEE